MRGVLLAAGFGRRYAADTGRDKLLEPLSDGRPLLWHSARTLCAVLPDSLAVIRPGQHERAHWLRLAGCQVLASAEAETGMGSALAAAVTASATASGWVVTLADMPWLPAEVIAAVAAALTRPAALAAARHHGQRGHPVGFGPAWGPQLQALHGDQGARALLAGQVIDWIDCDDDGVLRDVDRAADLHG